MSADLSNDMASQEVQDDLAFEIPEEIEPSDELHRDYLLSVVADYDLSIIEDIPHFTEVEEDSVISIVTGEILEAQRDNLQNFAPEDGFKDGDMRLCIHNAIEQILQESEGLAQQQGIDSPESPQDVFNYMLDKAANLRGPKTGIAVYQQFLERHEHDELWDYLVQSADPDVWSKVILAGKTQDFDVLDSLPSVPLPQEDGWYIAIITKRDGSRWYRGYGGQAFGLKGVHTRVQKGHMNNVLNKNQNSLFYRTWRGNVDVSDDSIESLDDLEHNCKFVCVGSDRSGLQGDDKSQFGNIAEMFFTAIFRFLQTKSLLEWLPPGSSLPVDGPVGCNVALPLWQHDADASKRSFHLLLRSDDQEVREWARSRILPGLAKARALRWVGDVDNSNIALGGRKAAKGKTKSHLRNCDESQGDEKVVRVKCAKCNTETDDTVPQYVAADGRYCARKMICEGSCQMSKAEKKSRQRSARTKHIPVANSKYASAKTGWISVSTAHNQINRDGFVAPAR